MMLKTFHEFNNIFNSKIITLPKNIICLGNYKGKIVGYKAQEFPRCNCIVQKIGKLLLSCDSEKYILLCTYDGYRERIAYKDGELLEYKPIAGDFDQKIEIDSKPGFTPVLHRDKNIFCFCKHLNDHTAICIPDAYIMGSYDSLYRNKFQTIDRIKIHWDEKKNELIYRGGLKAGGPKNFFFENTSNVSPRIKFLQCAQASMYSNIIHFGVNYVGIENIIKYKYLIDIDGNTNTWDSLVWKLYSGSVVLKQESIWKQWYYDGLKAWEHYIPLKNDFSDLDEIIEWSMSNDKKCKAIAASAKSFVEQRLNPAKVSADLEVALDDYLV
jgi:hypothetical protein